MQKILFYFVFTYDLNSWALCNFMQKLLPNFLLMEKIVQKL